MTTPPSAPYGQDPYGANPYGQQPHWGNPPGAGYPYPPSGPYASPPPGWSPGPYSPGPPPQGPRSKTPWLIVAAVAVLGVIALVVVLVLVFSRGSTPPQAGPASPPGTPNTPTSQPNGSAQTATDCTPNVSAGETPVGSVISAGKLSFPISAAPGWLAFADNQSPNLIDAIGVGQEVPGANQWMMQAEVAVTNFVASMDVAAQASKLLQCAANGPGYAQSSPTVGPTKTSSITVDGVKAARVDADITIADTARNVKGDSVTIVAVDTKPVTVFMGATPIGDAAAAATINRVIAALQVTKR